MGGRRHEAGGKAGRCQGKRAAKRHASHRAASVVPRRVTDDAPFKGHGIRTCPATSWAGPSVAHHVGTVGWTEDDVPANAQVRLRASQIEANAEHSRSLNRSSSATIVS
jgi:hypothetical protein